MKSYLPDIDIFIYNDYFMLNYKDNYLALGVDVLSDDNIHLDNNLFDLINKELEYFCSINGLDIPSNILFRRDSVVLLSYSFSRKLAKDLWGKNFDIEYVDSNTIMDYLDGEDMLSYEIFNIFYRCFEEVIKRYLRERCDFDV